MIKNSWLPVTISLSVLFCLNLLMVSSLAPNQFLKQLVAWIVGLVLFFVGTQINPKQLKNSRYLLFFFSCLFLVIPILLNNITRGSRRWIDMGPLPAIQPSELVKPLLLIFLTHTQYPLLLAIPVAIIMAQPDLGSAISVLSLLIPFVFYNKKLFRITLILSIIFILASPIIWEKVLHDYQKHRIINFINPASDPLGKGYNVIQSKIAIGSSGLLGKGYKKGSQGQLLFLPEKHTDFMFAATTEELGVFGVILILSAYFFLIKSLISRAFSQTNNRVLFLFTLGVAFQIWVQAFINIGMNVGILPVTGIPLPFLSVGGSSLMTLLFSIGIIFSS